MSATSPDTVLTVSDSTFRVAAVERIDYSLSIVDSVFAPEQPHLAEIFQPWSRCLAVVDDEVERIYGDRMRSYFAAHGIALTTFVLSIDETGKTMRTAERIVDAMGAFGLVRKEPVLVVGGGLSTDVAGFACSMFRRSTNYVRIPTTLIGLIDASVAIKVAVNHGHAKNRLGAFHASQQVILDFDFLGTLPTDQIRNGMAEIIKIATVGNAAIFELMEKYGEDLLDTRFARVDGSPELRRIADTVTYEAIRTMLELEVPNLHELQLDRVIAFGHTWSPTLELTPQPPYFHGHAISVDMALSTTIAALRGYVAESERDRILWLFSRLGLSIDSPHLTAGLLRDATRSIIQTRDGLLRAAMPHPIGDCIFVNDLTDEELAAALHEHRIVCGRYPRNGIGVEAFVGSGAVSKT
ncbi:sedoheptulose 7-phosphate cyclase [Branchiibius cervicis]|uniref:2-epi-5-epi-valiolone synthase n=1 Tax=Branchiibius cervicis TaxID=908252 RepID=A0ABW2AP41_9MICO